MADEETAKSEETKKPPAVVFETNEDFLRAAGERFDKKAKAAATQAAKEERKRLYEALGIDDDDELETVKTRLETSKQAPTEIEKLRKQLEKATKALTEADERVKSLEAYRVNHIKRSALAPFNTRVVDPDTLYELVHGKLGLDGDKVTGPDGSDLEKFVAAELERRPFLKAPDWKGGNGTKPNVTAPPSSQSGDQKPTNGGPPPPKNAAEAVRNLAQSMMAKYQEAQAAAQEKGGP